MNTLRIYCEIGSIGKVKHLEKDYNIEFVYFPYDISKTRHMKQSKKPSGLTADTAMLTADSTVAISDTEASQIFIELLRIIGTENKADARHIDTAFKEKCKIFITNDKKDIISKKEKLQELTQIDFFYVDELIQIENCIKSLCL